MLEIAFPDFHSANFEIYDQLFVTKHSIILWQHKAQLAVLFRRLAYLFSTLTELHFKPEAKMMFPGIQFGVNPYRPTERRELQQGKQ